MTTSLFCDPAFRQLLKRKSELRCWSGPDVDYLNIQSFDVQRLRRRSELSVRVSSVSALRQIWHSVIVGKFLTSIYKHRNTTFGEGLLKVPSLSPFIYQIVDKCRQFRPKQLVFLLMYRFQSYRALTFRLDIKVLKASLTHIERRLAEVFSVCTAI